MRKASRKTAVTVTIAIAWLSLVTVVVPSAMSGCELFVSFDRTKIQDSDASAVQDATSGDGRGGDDASMGVDAGADGDASPAFDAGSDSPAEVGADAATDAGCSKASDCPTPSNDCEDPACSAGVCGTTNKAKGAACTHNAGVVCDGSGNCVSMHCNDGVQDADETDVDCGGSCAPCADTKKCKVSNDCVDKVCSGVPSTCQAPTCSDGVQNGGESDVDCGGATCDGQGKTCSDTHHCAANADCTNSLCFGGTCVSCMDGVKDGNETDVDCGGVQCDAKGDACAVGKRCAANNDCTTGNCSGGTCALFVNGQTCTSSAQCSSGNCVGGVCCNTACTGTCQACTMALTGQADGTCGNVTAGSAAPAGQCTASPPCGNTGKCAAGGTCQQTSAGTPCVSCYSGQLTSAATCDGSGTCGSGSVAPCPGGLVCASTTACLPACSADLECQGTSSYCSNPGASGTCVAKGSKNASCSANDQCISGMCVSSVCQ